MSPAAPSLLRALLRGLLLAGCLGSFAAAMPVQAQAPLFLVNEETTVKEISFRFVESQTFTPAELKEHIATAEPGLLYQVQRFFSWVPFVSPQGIPFDPIELQKDVVRLRRFYNDRGFLYPRIDYPASQLDTTSNRIRVIFSIREGPPLIIEEVRVTGADTSAVAALLPEDLQEDWRRFLDRTLFEPGVRYTRYERLRMQEELIAWLRERGYAFARVNAEADIDSTANLAGVRFVVDPGPLAYVSEITVEGNESVEDDIVRRELPFGVGDRFSSSKLTQGQREIFGLNLFRVALANLPPQPRDSTVDVRVRVREGSLRYVTAQTGYAREIGVTLQGQWEHRNFFGGARTFTAGAILNTGLLGTGIGQGEDDVPQLIRGSVTLRQPYLFVTQLSGTFGPFAELRRSLLLRDPEEETLGFLKINQIEYGARTGLTYELLPYRTLNLSYALSRVDQRTTARAPAELPDGTDGEEVPGGEFTLENERDVFSRSVLTLSASLGRVNNYLNPQRGYKVQPFVGYAFGLPFLDAGVHYYQGGTEVIGYVPLARKVSLGLRLFGARTWPYGESEQNLYRNTPRASIFEDRFDDVVSYAGGANDVRGWGPGLVGPKTTSQVDFVRDEDTGAIIIDNDRPLTEDNRFEAAGGLAKLAGNAELRTPFPGLGDKWRLAFFLDAGQVSSAFGAGNEIEDRGNLSLNLSDFRYGTGAGLRYETPIGFVRLDIAYKLNPDERDLQDPRDVFLHEVATENTGRFPRLRQDLIDAGFDPSRIEPPEERFINRFNVHISIGQAF